MSYLLKVLFIIMGLYSAICLAETHNENDPVTMEFLEFLSEWETEQGDWVGPERFEDDSFDQLYDTDEIETDNEDEE